MSDFSTVIPPHGWVKNPEEVARITASLPYPYLASAAPHLYGAATPKTVLLYRAWKEVLGDYIKYPAQQIGDCVGRGFSEGVDLLECVQIVLGNKTDQFKETSHEAVYGMSRVDIGKLRGLSANEDGSCGAWAAQAVSQLGTVDRDVTGPYSDVLAKKWGATGVPAAIKAQAANHKVKTVSQVQTYKDLGVALANGYPVAVCSDQGFTLKRDQNGFVKPEGQWGHCMLICGIRVDSTPGACILQSWGINDGPPGPYGPTSLDQPLNSFWADVDTVSRMLAEGDSWALSSFDGYPAQAAKLSKSLFRLL